MTTPAWEQLARFMYLDKKITPASSHKTHYKAIESFFKNKAYTRDTVLDFFVSLDERGLSPSTKNNHYKTLRHILSILGNADIIEDWTYYRTTAVYIEVLTEDECRELVACKLPRRPMYAKDQIRYDIMIETFLRTGMRNNELCDLMWNEVKDNAIVVKCGKGQKMRVIPVEPDLIQKIRSLPHHDHGYVFGTHRGSLNHGTVNDELHKRADALGWTRSIYAHLLRHTFCTTTLAKGAPLAKVQQIMGHSDPKTTSRYAHFVTQQLKEVSARAPLARVTASFLKEDFEMFLDKYKGTEFHATLLKKYSDLVSELPS